MPTDSRMRGVYAIPVTPFDTTGAIHEADLRACVEFCLAGGAHGIVAPVVASEFTALTDAERALVTRIVIDTVDGRVPVVAGVSGTSTAHAVASTRTACEAGADAVLAMPPFVRRGNAQETYDYYAAIAAEAQRPVFIQHWGGPFGVPISSPLMLKMVREIEHVTWIKEESAQAPHVMSEVLAAYEPKLSGVMGGVAGRYLIQEHRRGSSGTMPACEFVDIHVQLWDLLEAGDEECAADLMRRLLPLLVLEMLLGSALAKEVLVARGVISTTVVRGPGIPPLDHHDREDLRQALKQLDGYWRVSPPITSSVLNSGAQR